MGDGRVVNFEKFNLLLDLRKFLLMRNFYFEIIKLIRGKFIRYLLRYCIKSLIIFIYISLFSFNIIINIG